MDMLEALRRVEDSKGKLVARCRSWRGTPHYICLERRTWLEQSLGLSMSDALLPRPHDIFHEWEVVEVGQISKEMQEAKVRE